MITVHVSTSYHKERLDVFLSSIEPQTSRSFWQKQIKMTGVFLNHIQTQRSADRVHSGDTVTYDPSFLQPSSEEIKPTPIPLQIIYEDDDLIVIDKQSGLVVHPACGHQEDTLVNGLLFLNKQLSDTDSVRPGIVHRLDKDTSGLLIVAKNNQSHQILSELIAERKIKRRYDVLVAGQFSSEYLLCETFIARDKRNRKKMAVFTREGKIAITHFHLKKHFSHASWLTAELQTGRTHQIRVQLKHLNFPVLGDPVYGSSKKDKALHIQLSRQALHASHLSFPHPHTQEILDFNSPLPVDMTDTITLLEEGPHSSF